MNIVNNELILDILINDVQLTLSLSDDTKKQTLFKNVLYCRKAFCNLFSINHTILNDVEFKINKKSINFINKIIISLIEQISKTVIFICILISLQALLQIGRAHV